MSRSMKSSFRLEQTTSQTNAGTNAPSTGRRKSVALRTGSFDEQQLLRAELATRHPNGPSQTGHPNAPPQSSPKFFRTQSFGDRLLASASPKFVKSKKMFHSIGPKSSSSTVLFFPPNDPSSSPTARMGGPGFGSRRKYPAESTNRAPHESSAGVEPDHTDPLGAYREELRQLRQLQKERFRSRSSSISIERWNESATGQR
uniref:Uncharacterized protein n=1 Tax=Anopheles culicifacies TaxID=139723 RepID=A0A182M5Q5_9DIPT